MLSARLIWLWLATREHVCTRNIAALLRDYGTAEHIFASNRHALEDGAHWLTAIEIDALCDKELDQAEQIAADCDAKGISVLTMQDAGYPERLRNIIDPPIVLYVYGTLPDFDHTPGLAVVGTRNATPYGLRIARGMGRGLATAGFTVVTGMAKGVDGEANRGALQASGKTVAILGCGLDICYPKENRYLMADIRAYGAVISEYPPGVSPLPQHFPIRNRILSGLTVGTLVIEAGMRSGALITARAALDQGRDVFAVPGNLDMPSFEGANRMVSNGEARLVLTPVDIAYEYEGLLPESIDEKRILSAFHHRPQPFLHAKTTKKEKIKGSTSPEKASAVHAAEPCKLPEQEKKPYEGLTEAEHTILCAVQQGVGTADDIVEATGLSAPQVNASITMLELNGIVKRQAGRLVCVVR